MMGIRRELERENGQRSVGNLCASVRRGRGSGGNTELRVSKRGAIPRNECMVETRWGQGSSDYDIDYDIENGLGLPIIKGSARQPTLRARPLLHHLPTQ